MKMEIKTNVDYDKLIKVKEELEKCEEIKWSESQSKDGVIMFSHPIYPSWVYELVKITRPCYQYDEIVKEIKKNKIEIEKLNFLQVQAMLTMIYRQERFCDGYIAQNIKNKNLLKLLERLITIYNEGEE